MRLLIDNEDGKGQVDYTPAVLKTETLTVRRVRGTPGTCTAGLDVIGSALVPPVDRARVQVWNDAGALLFAGYVAGAPWSNAALATTAGVWSAVRFQAVEDGWLLHNLPAPSLQPDGSSVFPIDPLQDAVRWHDPGVDALALRAADVTVCGAHEATTYVTELFRGDGTTASFPLMDVPFRESGRKTLLTDSFEGAHIDGRLWKLVDSGQRIGLGSAGLRVTGGNGLDGQTLLQAVQPVEMGGSLTAELDELTLQAGSDGVLLGMYSNIVNLANCFAGFRIKGTAGARSIVALVGGVEKGTSYTFNEGHRYKLRLRLHCAEMQRVWSSYQAVVDGAVQTFGQGSGVPPVNAPMQIVFEVQDLGLASNTVATVLYAGAVASSPAQCVFAPVNSIALVCQTGACALTQHGSAWAVSTLPDGTVATRREGVAEDGADFSLSGSTVLFFPGRVPVANELVTVVYRRGQRSFARLQDPAAIAAMQTQALPGVPTWSGAVTAPVPRSSGDCRYAAAALLAFGASAATGMAGECVPADPAVAAALRPGDRLLLPIRGAKPVPISVKSTTLVDGHAVPEVLTGTVQFGQDRENGLSFAIQNGLAEDVLLPVAASAAALSASLPGLQVVSATDAALQIDAGTVAPNGGGFEVRRRDGGFGSDDDDLVLRSPVRSFSLPRTAFRERFYVRMYDGASSPAYSERSRVVVTHLAVNSEAAG